MEAELIFLMQQQNYNGLPKAMQLSMGQGRPSCRKQFHEYKDKKGMASSGAYTVHLQPWAWNIFPQLDLKKGSDTADPEQCVCPSVDAFEQDLPGCGNLPSLSPYLKPCEEAASRRLTQSRGQEEAEFGW